MLTPTRATPRARARVVVDDATMRSRTEAATACDGCSSVVVAVKAVGEAAVGEAAPFASSRCRRRPLKGEEAEGEEAEGEETRAPQSTQSVPRAHHAYSEPTPPSSQKPSDR